MTGSGEQQNSGHQGILEYRSTFFYQGVAQPFGDLRTQTFNSLGIPGMTLVMVCLKKVVSDSADSRMYDKRLSRKEYHMSKGFTSIFIAWAVVVMLCLAAHASDSQIADYKLAISEYFETPLEKVVKTAEQGITLEDLPVVFFIARNAKIEPEVIVKTRLKGRSWSKIAAEHDMTAADFYVYVKGKNHGARFTQIMKKFAGLKKEEFDQIQLSNDEITALVNLRFLYKHYNYSQHLIMTWSGEGKSFVEINSLVSAAMEPAAEAKPVQDTSEADSTK